jgi:hypothetical protein
VDSSVRIVDLAKYYYGQLDDEVERGQVQRHKQQEKQENFATYFQKPFMA